MTVSGGAEGAYVEGRIMVCGGIDGGDTSSIYRFCHEYDVVGDFSDESGPMLALRNEYSGVMLHDGTWWLTGGEGTREWVI